MNKNSSALSHEFPVVARLLGYSGVIPFVALALCVATGIDLSTFGVNNVNQLLLAYAAIIISFIGAVHWGIALNSATHKTRLYTYSVVPALVAWGWLFLAEKMALMGMAATVVAVYFIDRLWLKDCVPGGYLNMRLHLTIVVSLSLLVAALAR